jgi:hypothetical protein
MTGTPFTERLIDAAWAVASLPIYITAVVFIKAADWWIHRDF